MEDATTSVGRPSSTCAVARPIQAVGRSSMAMTSPNARSADSQSPRGRQGEGGSQLVGPDVRVGSCGIEGRLQSAAHSPSAAAITACDGSWRSIRHAPGTPGTTRTAHEQPRWQRSAQGSTETSEPAWEPDPALAGRIEDRDGDADEDGHGRDGVHIDDDVEREVDEPEHRRPRPASPHAISPRMAR